MLWCCSAREPRREIPHAEVWRYAMPAVSTWLATGMKREDLTGQGTQTGRGRYEICVPEFRSGLTKDRHNDVIPKGSFSSKPFFRFCLKVSLDDPKQHSYGCILSEKPPIEPEVRDDTERNQKPFGLILTRSFVSGCSLFGGHSLCVGRVDRYLFAIDISGRRV